MSFFDFLKPKATIQSQLDNAPELQQAVFKKKLQNTISKVESLRAVGREDDAVEVITGYMLSYTDFLANDTSNPSRICFFTEAAISLGVAVIAETILKALILKNNDKPTMDLTVVYFELGRLYHQMRTDPEIELSAYESSIEAACPSNCKYPATEFDKIKAHHFASLCAFRAGKEEHEKWHDYRKRELAPEVNWEDPYAVLEWLKTGLHY